MMNDENKCVPPNLLKKYCAQENIRESSKSYGQRK